MSKSIPGNHKHMTQDDRITIEKGLDNSFSLRKIAESIGKDPSTVSKEIKKHRTAYGHNTFNEPSNKCALYSTCRKKHICGERRPACNKQSHSCYLCNRICPDFIPRSYHCSLLDKAPFVCNGCGKKCCCRLDKYYYRASTANREYRTILRESMSHINSAPRESLGGMTPYALAKLMLPESLMKALSLWEVEPDDVKLTPALMEK